MELASVRQVSEAQTAVSCVRVVHLVKTVLSDVTARMVLSARLRTDVVTVRPAGRGSNVTDLAMRNSTGETATITADVSTTLRATHRMVHAGVRRGTWGSYVSASVSQAGLDWNVTMCVTVTMTTVLVVIL